MSVEDMIDENKIEVEIKIPPSPNVDVNDNGDD